jgi:septal ring factor EnvC (AmiA/AmiB activator)
MEREEKINDSDYQLNDIDTRLTDSQTTLNKVKEQITMLSTNLANIENKSNKIAFVQQWMAASTMIFLLSWLSWLYLNFCC